MSFVPLCRHGLMLATCSPEIRLVVLRCAAEQLALQKGIELRAALPQNALLKLVSLARATSKQCLLRGRMKGCSLTKPLDFVIDTRGTPRFVEFRIKFGRAFNGTPAIGFLDPSTSWQDGYHCLGCTGMSSKLELDLSRSRCTEHPLAIAFHPNDGRILASCRASLDCELQGLEESTRPGRSLQTKLNWKQLADEGRRQPSSLRAGFMIKDNCLEAFRHEGHWISSGVICRKLPQQLQPCIFLFHFVGFAEVTLLEVSDAQPATYETSNISGWTCWP